MGNDLTSWSPPQHFVPAMTCHASNDIIADTLSVKAQSQLTQPAGEYVRYPDQVRAYSRSSPPALTPRRFKFVVDDRVVPHIFRGSGEFDNRPVSITYHGAPMEYDLGNGQVRSSQLTMRKTIGELLASPLWVTIVEEDVSRLCVNVKLYQ